VLALGCIQVATLYECEILCDFFTRAMQYIKAKAIVSVESTLFNTAHFLLFST